MGFWTPLPFFLGLMGSPAAGGGSTGAEAGTHFLGLAIGNSMGANMGL